MFLIYSRGRILLKLRSDVKYRNDRAGGVCGADHERTVSAFLPRWNYFEHARPLLVAVKRLLDNSRHVGRSVDSVEHSVEASTLSPEKETA